MYSMTIFFTWFVYPLRTCVNLYGIAGQAHSLFIMLPSYAHVQLTYDIRVLRIVKL